MSLLSAVRGGVRSGGAVGGLLSVVAIGAAAGLAAERYAVGRVRLRPDPHADEPFGALPADRTGTVLTEDGVRLHVEEVGPADAPLTVVLVHGYTQELAVWHFQRQALAARGDVRVVLYDQRAHGRSGRGDPERSTIAQLGADLEQVLAQCVPDGPVVLAGHSMGGMTVMALADRAPALFAGGRVAGVALLATSTGRLAEVTFGLPAAVGAVGHRVAPVLARGLRRRPALFEQGRRLGSDLAFLLARRGGFARPDVSPALVELVERMTAATPVDVIAEFYGTFTDHDALGAIDVLRGLPVLVVVGDGDLLTPPSHSEVIAEALPEAELVVVAEAGHMVLLEHPELVSGHLLALLERARAR